MHGPELQAFDDLPLVPKLSGMMDLDGNPPLRPLADQLGVPDHPQRVRVFRRRGVRLDQVELRRADVRRQGQHPQGRAENRQGGDGASPCEVWHG